MNTLQPLHNLFQIIHPSYLSLPYPLLLFTQLHRDLLSNQVEWHLVLAFGSQIVSSASDQEIFWHRRLSMVEVDNFLQIKDAAVQGDKLIQRLKEAVLEGKLDVKGLTEDCLLRPGQNAERAEVQLIFNITASLSIPLVLHPVSSSPFSLAVLMTELIPSYLTATSSRIQAAEAKAQLSSIQKDHARALGEKDRAKDEVKRLKLTRGGTSAKGGGTVVAGGPSGSQGKRDGLTVVPGVTHRAILTPGMPGFQGDASRLGLLAVAQDEGFESASDSD